MFTNTSSHHQGGTSGLHVCDGLGNLGAIPSLYSLRLHLLRTIKKTCCSGKLLAFPGFPLGHLAGQVVGDRLTVGDPLNRVVGDPLNRAYSHGDLPTVVPDYNAHPPRFFWSGLKWKKKNCFHQSDSHLDQIIWESMFLKLLHKDKQRSKRIYIFENHYSWTGRRQCYRMFQGSGFSSGWARRGWASRQVIKRIF